jgi:carbon storage regulator
VLVLSRKKNETIMIGHDISIIVVGIHGDKVRLGIEAPKDVPVHRREVYDAIARSEGDVVELAHLGHGEARISHRGLSVSTGTGQHGKVGAGNGKTAKCRPKSQSKGQPVHGNRLAQTGSAVARR